MPPNEQITLAPMAGAGIGKLLAERLLAEPGFVDSMVAAVVNGLKATRSFYVKDEGMHTEPDAKTQLQAFALVLAHMEGEPVKRIIHQHLGGAGGIDPLAALQESPELREAAARLLQKAEFRTRHSKKAEPADAPAVEV